MSARKRQGTNKAVLTKFGEFGTFKKFQSGRVKTLRGRPKATDVFDQNSNSADGLRVPVAAQAKGSGRSSMKNIFQPLTQGINDLKVNPFQNALPARPPLVMETYKAEASITLSKHEIENAVSETNKIFNFLWDSDVNPNDNDSGKVQKRNSNENVVISF